MKKGPVTILKEKVTTLETELKEYKDKYLRALAELDNYRKRMEREFEDFKIHSKGDFIMKIIPVLDNFDRALAGAVLNENYESFYKGMEIIYRQLKEILKSMGLEEYSGLGEKFDPTLHEALGVVVVNDQPENIIIEEISKGYKLGEKIIKPARVLVSKFEEKKEEIKGGEENGENNRD